MKAIPNHIRESEESIQKEVRHLLSAAKQKGYVTQWNFDSKSINSVLEGFKEFNVNADWNLE